MPSGSQTSVDLQAHPDPSVDTPAHASLSFAPPEPSPRSFQPDGSDRKLRRAPIAVGPGRPAIVARTQPGGLLGAMPEFPVQLSKVQAPPLRDETLARERLLDWL